MNKTKAQMIAELTCQRFFATKGFKVLPPKFWSDQRFSRHYKLQIIKANGLLKIYSFDAIMNALKSKEGKNAYSLNAKWVDSIIATEEQKIKNLQRKVDEHAIKPQENCSKIDELLQTMPIRPSFSPSKSILETLENNKNTENQYKMPFEPPY